MQLSIPSAELPFDDNTILHSSDINEAQEVVNSTVAVDERKYTLLKQKSSIQIDLTKASLNSLAFYGCRFGNISVNAKSAPLRSFQLIIPCNGSLYNNVLKTEINPGEMAFFVPGSEIDLDFRDIKSSIVFLINVAQMEQYLGRRIDGANYGSGEMESLQRKYLLGDPEIAGLVNIINTIYIDSVSGRALLNSWQCRQSLENILFESVSSLLPELDADQSIKLVPGKLKIAVEYIEENKRRPISVLELVNITGYSRRALENRFKSSFGIGPRKYVSQKRMLAIRQILLKSVKSENTVADIAAQWGYFNLSYFIKLYRDHFGETPATTLRLHH